MKGFLFSNYQNLNNGNLLLESAEILKQKWHKTTKNGMVNASLFSNYQNLNNRNLLLESGEILKQKWHKTTKNCMVNVSLFR